MNTEITENRAGMPAGWIFYDAACRSCVRGRYRTGRLFESRGFQWLPLQTPGAAERLGVPASAFEIRMHLLTPNGRVLHNADALSLLCRQVWWLWPIGVALLVPGFRELGRVIYDWFARNRYRIGGACDVSSVARGGMTFVDCAVALMPPVVAGLACWLRPPWVLMWSLAFGLGLGLKWLTWRDAVSRGARPTPRRVLAWFTLWPGMDAHAFFYNKPIGRPELQEWCWTAASTTLGISMIWMTFPRLVTKHPMLAGWVGMLGIVLLLHFGGVRVLSILLRWFGRNSPPIMNAPLRATSLAEFWGQRWNTAFSVPARRMILRPLARLAGLPAAGFLVFLISGLLHELVISLPARAGFGLPTLYFVLQGIGTAFEHSAAGRRMGLGKGFKGRLLMALFTMGPIYWLFHPVFVRDVLVPFLKVLNSL
jgi:predicted DCC family thiol-disulfide oxidoreductase YuxK